MKKYIQNGFDEEKKKNQIISRLLGTVINFNSSILKKCTTIHRLEQDCSFLGCYFAAIIFQQKRLVVHM